MCLNLIINRYLPIILILLFGCVGVQSQIPEVILIGSNPISVYLGENFVDPGATVTNFPRGPATLYGVGNVNTSSLGSYTLTYSAELEYSLTGPDNTDPARKVAINSMEPYSFEDTISYSRGGWDIKVNNLAIYYNGQFRSFIDYTADREGQIFSYIIEGTSAKLFGVFIDGQSVDFTSADTSLGSANIVSRTVSVILNPVGDQDGDNLTNAQEELLGSNPFSDDSNSDGIKDGIIHSVGLNPTANIAPLLNSLKSNPVTGLYNEVQYNLNRANGRAEILSNPNPHGLFTTNQIHNLGLGGVVLSKSTNNQLILNYKILQSSDLQNWLSYEQYNLVISNVPSDKMFLRIQAVGE